MKRQLDIDPEELTLDVNEAYNLMIIAESFHQIVPCDKITFKRMTALAYEFKLETVDGRTWKQTLDFSAPPETDPVMTFEVTDAWRAHEVSASRPLRDLCTALVVKYLTLDSITYKL